MGKRTLSILLALMLVFALFFGCSAPPQEEQEAAPTENPATNTPEQPSEQVTPVPPAPGEPVEDDVAAPGSESGAAQGSEEMLYDFPLVCDCDKPVSIDLDGDGADEEVVYAPAVLGENYPSIINSLTVNGTEFAERVYDTGFYSDWLVPEHFCITDIDNSDGLLELAIMDYGPSDDLSTSFFRWNGTELEYLGRISGFVCDPYSGESDFTFHSDGSISSYVRLSVLQTWFASATYILGEDGFELAPQELYYPVSSSFCTGLTVTEPVAVYSDNSTDSERGTLPVGTELNLVATDNAEWVCANINGKELWLHLDPEKPFMLELEHGYDYAGAGLSGLCMAD